MGIFGSIRFVESNVGISWGSLEGSDNEEPLSGRVRML